ncbi:MAG TPA: hypothetical protein VGI93_14470 [Steroidobacteraceae bacterium]|jgi:hypothetical protein
MKFAWYVGLMVLTLTGCASTGSNKSADEKASQTVLTGPPLGIPMASSKHLVLNMTGSPEVTAAKDWPKFQEEWRANFSEYAKSDGVTFEVQSGEAHATGAPGTLIKVYVNDYRFVGIGSRVMFGVMTGNAYIDAKASYCDLTDGKEIGVRAYNTSSTAWAGVFAKMTPQQVDAIGSQVFAELKSAK